MTQAQIQTRIDKMRFTYLGKDEEYLLKSVLSGINLATGSGVVSVFGRSGAVTAQSGDYSFSLISGTAGPTQGGTGLASYAKGDVLVATGTNTLGVVAASATDGYVFTWDAASGLPMWKAASGGGGGSVAGTDSQIQFNDSGSFGADSGLTYSKTNKKLTIAGGTSNGAFSFGTLVGYPSWYLYEGLSGDRYGIGFNTLEFQTFAKTSSVISWNSGGDFQPFNTNRKMTLSMSTGNLTIVGKLTASGISNSGTNEGTNFNFIWTGSRKLMLYYDTGGTSGNWGVGINTNEIQTYGPNTGYHTWNNAGDFKSTGTNEVMRLHLSTGSLLLGTTTVITSSILTLASTTKGFLPPRMTTTQKNAITSPAEGLVLYDNVLKKLCLYNGTAWETITSA